MQLSGFECCCVTRLAEEEENLVHLARTCLLCVFPVFLWDIKCHYQGRDIGLNANVVSSPSLLQAIPVQGAASSHNHSSTGVVSHLPSDWDSEGKSSSLGASRSQGFTKSSWPAHNTAAGCANSAWGMLAFPESPTK